MDTGVFTVETRTALVMVINLCRIHGESDFFDSCHFFTKIIDGAVACLSETSDYRGYYPPLRFSPINRSATAEERVAESNRLFHSRQSLLPTKVQLTVEVLHDIT